MQFLSEHPEWWDNEDIWTVMNAFYQVTHLPINKAGHEHARLTSR